MQGRIILVVTSPRVAPGLLSWPAWQRLTTARAVLAADPEQAWRAALAEAGVAVQDVGDLPVAVRAGRLLELLDGGPEGGLEGGPGSGLEGGPGSGLEGGPGSGLEGGQGSGPEGPPGREVVWLGSPDGDPGLTDALAEHLSRRAVAGRPPEVELVTGSFDVPGSRLLDLVAVMDRLRSPGGCPWDAEQTHRSLLPYLLEEAHEVIEAAESDDREHLQEELGDLLLQVVFHARVAQDDPGAPFDIDDVAAGIVAKLVRRHPHVFAGVEVADLAELTTNWETIKAQEKPRDGVFDGIPASLPALARAQKMAGRLSRGADGPAGVRAALAEAAAGDPVATALVEAILQATAQDVDAESALRAALRRLESGTM